MSTESQLEQQLLEKLIELKYEHRPDITEGATLEQNFRTKFEALNRVRLPRAEQQRLADCLISLDARIGREAGRLVTLNAFKAGLRQHLLPSPEATIG